MPIQVLCTGCQARLKAPDTAAGKKTRCPKCQTVVSVPAAAGELVAAGKSAAALTVAKKKPDQWFLQTPDGSQYGPVVRDELDQWFSEGRVSTDCQLLKEGSTQWQWAAEIYPTLSKMSATTAAPFSSPSEHSSLGSAPAMNPLTPLTSGGPFSDPLGSLPLGSGGLSPLGSAPSSTMTLPSYTSTPSLSSGAYGQPASAGNPYSASTLGAGYGTYPQRSGPHPMVIVAGIFHILMGCWNAFNCLFFSFGALALMALGGAAGAAGAAGNPDPKTEGAMAAFAAFGVIGGIIVFAIALCFLAYGVMQVVSGIGLFMRKQWARTATFTFASLGVVATLVYLGLIIFAMTTIGAIEYSSIIGLIGEIAYVPILFLAMLLPDANKGFR
jgi:hypothetical protein